jgi:uncharacterized protein YndB with AHSA1/START domain
MAQQSIVRISRPFPFPAEQVFDAWLDPDVLRRWFGAGLGEVLRVDIEPRVGGELSIVQHVAGREADHRGKLLELDRPRRLAFSWGLPLETPEVAKVTVDIAARDGGCTLALVESLTHPSPQALKLTRRNWEQMLADLQQAPWVRDGH